MACKSLSPSGISGRLGTGGLGGGGCGGGNGRNVCVFVGKVVPDVSGKGGGKGVTEDRLVYLGKYAQSKHPPTRIMHTIVTATAQAVAVESEVTGGSMSKFPVVVVLVVLLPVVIDAVVKVEEVRLLLEDVCVIVEYVVEAPNRAVVTDVVADVAVNLQRSPNKPRPKPPWTIIAEFTTSQAATWLYLALGPPFAMKSHVELSVLNLHRSSQADPSNPPWIQSARPPGSQAAT